MKFKHKVYDHKRKVGIDFGSFGPNNINGTNFTAPDAHFDNT